MSKTLIGYARCSTDKQDLAAQRAAPIELGVDPKRIYTVHGLTGTNRHRPGLDQALAAVRGGNTLVVPKLESCGVSSRSSRKNSRRSCDACTARGNIRSAIWRNSFRSHVPRFTAPSPGERDRHDR
jgi:DNA invertase Pin-like site-specific DNA recombinase